MGREKNGKLLFQALYRTRALHITVIFIVFVFVAALIMTEVEPGFETYGDSLWYCYVNLFTIGFGDMVPVTVAGRILSVILTVYATAVIAVVTGVMASFFTDRARNRAEITNEELIYKATHLDKLSKAELKELSVRIRRRNSGN